MMYAAGYTKNLKLIFEKMREGLKYQRALDTVETILL